MAGAVTFSLSELDKVGGEIEQISAGDIPTLLICESIARNNLEQALNFEKALRYAAEGDLSNSAPIREAREEFLKLSTLTASAFAEGDRVLRARTAGEFEGGQTDHLSPWRQHP